MLKLYGHHNVKLINGGRKKWELDGRELTTRRSRSAPQTAYTGRRSQDTSIRAFRDEVIAAIGDGNAGRRPLARGVPGELLAPAHLPQEQAQRAGHIPGAANIPWSQGRRTRTAPSSPTTSSASSTAARASTADKTVIAYCRIGERSSHTWFVLHELLGYPEVKNYDGCWTEYGSLVGVPVVRGDERGSVRA